MTVTSSTLSLYIRSALPADGVTEIEHWQQQHNRQRYRYDAAVDVTGITDITDITDITGITGITAVEHGQKWRRNKEY